MFLEQSVTRTTGAAISLRPGRRRLAATTAVAAVVAGLLLIWRVGQTGQIPFLRRESVWSVAMYHGPTPWEIAPTNSNNVPVLTAHDVHDVRALFVADPFVTVDRDRWSMFVEVLNAKTYQGDIGLATSQDGGKHWEYQKIVLDEPFHLSYPQVFTVDGNWYMVPEAEASGGVQLYISESFPYGWKHLKTLLVGERCADPTLFRHADKWWMFVGQSHTHDSLRLYFADELTGEWTEHPMSPVVRHNADMARPGGRVVECDGHLVRFGQDCNPRYGNQLWAFEITELSVISYQEKPMGERPVIQGSGTGWNAIGMHHNDAHRLDDGTWRAAVDGHRKKWFFPWEL